MRCLCSTVTHPALYSLRTPAAVPRTSPSNAPSSFSRRKNPNPYPRNRSLLSKSTPDPIDFAPPPDSDLDGVASADEDGFELEVTETDKRNRRRIRSRVRVDADLEAVWRVLTDYEGLAGFIPSLAECRLIEKRDKFARLYQVGQQDLALGLKFDAKGVLDCYEGDLEVTPSGRRRDIEFNMVEGDFQVFEGRWSIEQIDSEMHTDEQFLIGKEYQTTLSYVVELEPKFWLPVHLLEGRLCREVKNNILCVREEAQRVQRGKRGTLTANRETSEDDANRTA